MRKLLLLCLLLSFPVLAADNTVILTPGSGVTMRTQDVGSGVQSPYNILGNISGTTIYGTAGSSNVAVLSVQGIASGTALPVSLTSTTITGTVAATQSGTWTVQPGNTANSTPWLMTGSGSAGTAATGVLTVQGIASMTPVQVSQATGTNLHAVIDSGTITTVTTVTTLSTLTGGGVASAAADSGNPIKIGGKYNSSPITLTDGNRGDLQLDVNGYVKVNVATATGLAQGSTTSGQTGSLIMGAVTTTAPSYTTAQTSPMSLDASGGLRVGSQYPAGSIPITASATGTTAATSATLSTTGSVTTYICGFSIRSNATSATTSNATVTGTISAGTMNFMHWTAPAASGIGLSEMIFHPCIPASAVNTTIAVNAPAPGSGGLVSVSAWGYQRAAQ